MKICQKLYEEGYITYMRTDSEIYSEEFIEEASKYITKQYGVEYGIKEGNNLPHKAKANVTAQEAHEAIRPTKPDVSLLDEKVFSQKECKMYQLIWSNALESLMAPALYKGITASITAPQAHMYKFSTEQVVFKGWKIVNGCEEINKEFVYLQTLKPQSVVKYKKITAKVSMKDLKNHYTEAKLVQLLEQQGIGRPSTFSSLIDKIQERGYVKKENVKGISIKCQDYELSSGGKLDQILTEREFGNEKNKLVIKPLGIMVLEYLLIHFKALFEYDYTKQMEEHLDEIAQRKKVWSDLCRECLTDLEAPIKLITEAQRGKETIRIDNEHMYMMGKYGPVIKCINDTASTTSTETTEKITFKAVKPDLDLDKLRNGEYTLEEIVSEPSAIATGRLLGTYNTKDVYLKSGKFGWYIEWGTEKKALKLTLPEATALTLDDIADTLYDIENGDSSMIRIISKETSIRKGKFGDYIFHKNKKMKKPKFLKLTDFKEDYKTCPIDSIHTWLKKTYDINKCE